MATIRSSEKGRYTIQNTFNLKDVISMSRGVLSLLTYLPIMSFDFRGRR